jgi:hypothetical protein
MNTRFTNAYVLSEPNIKLAKKCLLLIRDMAERAAYSEDREHLGYVIEELSQVLFARSGSKERLFEPVQADFIPDLDKLREELAWVDWFSQEMTMERDWKLRVGPQGQAWHASIEHRDIPM